MKRRFCSQFLGMNSTVLYQNNAALLVDPGVFPNEIKKIKNHLTKFNLKKISIVLTHTHGDHISGWNFFKDQNTFGHQSINQKSIAVRENDLRYLKGIYRKLSIENLDTLSFPDNIQYLSNGKLIEILPYSFLFFHTPGHSIDMSVIIVPEEKLLFSGDMLIDSPVPYILHSSRQYWNSLKYIKSIVYEYEIHCLIPGHGKIAQNQEEIIARIENEQLYLQRMVWQGIKLYRMDMEEKEIFNHLLGLTSASIHAHRINIHTIMRELKVWSAKEESQLNLD
jgi:hydroxyacylglutathione hydrolase